MVKVDNIWQNHGDDLLWWMSVLTLQNSWVSRGFRRCSMVNVDFFEIQLEIRATQKSPKIYKYSFAKFEWNKATLQIHKLPTCSLIQKFPVFTFQALIQFVPRWILLVIMQPLLAANVPTSGVWPLHFLMWWKWPSLSGVQKSKDDIKEVDIGKMSGVRSHTVVY